MGLSVPYRNQRPVGIFGTFSQDYRTTGSDVPTVRVVVAGFNRTHCFGQCCSLFQIFANEFVFVPMPSLMFLAAVPHNFATRATVEFSLREASTFADGTGKGQMLFVHGQDPWHRRIGRHPPTPCQERAPLGRPEMMRQGVRVGAGVGHFCSTPAAGSSAKRNLIEVFGGQKIDLKPLLTFFSTNSTNLGYRKET
jgi:hypothetical protein